MTDLIQKQLDIITIMFCCGITAGLVLDVFRLFYRRFFKGKKGLKGIIGIIASVVIAFLINEYSFFCQNGKLTFVSAVAFFGGLLLWYKYFYDIILLGEKDEQKRKKAP